VTANGPAGALRTGARFYLLPTSRTVPNASDHALSVVPDHQYEMDPGRPGRQAFWQLLLRKSLTRNRRLPSPAGRGIIMSARLSKPVEGALANLVRYRR
jgi:hypothetical protein